MDEHTERHNPENRRDYHRILRVCGIVFLAVFTSATAAFTMAKYSVYLMSERFDTTIPAIPVAHKHEEGEVHVTCQPKPRGIFR